MAQAPYQATNIVFNKDDRFRFGSRKQHPVNNMLFFESAVRAENKVFKLPKSVSDKPHEWDYEGMLKASKDAEERRKLPRGMTARPDPIVQQKIDQLERTLQRERNRRKQLDPIYNQFLNLFKGAPQQNIHDDFEPIPLSSVAKARREKIEARKRQREERLRNLRRDYGSVPRSKRQQAAAASRERGPKLTSIQAQILKAKLSGKPVPTKGIMSQSASRGLLD